MGLVKNSQCNVRFHVHRTAGKFHFSPCDGHGILNFCCLQSAGKFHFFLPGPVYVAIDC